MAYYFRPSFEYCSATFWLLILHINWTKFSVTKRHWNCLQEKLTYLLQHSTTIFDSLLPIYAWKKKQKQEISCKFWNYFSSTVEHFKGTGSNSFTTKQFSSYYLSFELILDLIQVRFDSSFRVIKVLHYSFPSFLHLLLRLSRKHSHRLSREASLMHKIITIVLKDFHLIKRFLSKQNVSPYQLWLTMVKKHYKTEVSKNSPSSNRSADVRNPSLFFKVSYVLTDQSKVELFCLRRYPAVSPKSKEMKGVSLLLKISVLKQLVLTSLPNWVRTCQGQKVCRILTLSRNTPPDFCKPTQQIHETNRSTIQRYNFQIQHTIWNKTVQPGHIDEAITRSNRQIRYV